MNEQILEAIDAEIARLQQARDILASALSSSPQTSRKKAAKAKGVRRELSPQARKAIADAQKKRWAKVKREKKAAATTRKEAAAG